MNSAQSANSDPHDEHKDKFLLAMYGQLWTSINIYIQVVGQSVAVIFAAFGLFALVEKGVISLDIGSAMLVVACTWLAAHAINTSYWYRQNLAVVIQIERHFLEDEVQRFLPFVPADRGPSRLSIPTYAWIQISLAAVIALLVLVFHFSDRVAPTLVLDPGRLDLPRCLPYFATAVGMGLCGLLYVERNRAYRRMQCSGVSPSNGP